MNAQEVYFVFLQYLIFPFFDFLDTGKDGARKSAKEMIRKAFFCIFLNCIFYELGIRLKPDITTKS